MTGVLVAVALVAVLVAVAVFVVIARRRRRPADGVAQFRRHIRALSSEARRPVVDQVQQLDGEDDATPPGRIRLRGGQRRDG